MKREEAFKNRPMIVASIGDQIDIDEFITKIYDDFESRTCENCSKAIMKTISLISYN